MGLEADERFQPSSLGTNSTGSESGMILDNNLKKKFDQPIFVQKNLAMWSKCRLCNKSRCLFILCKDKGEKRSIIREVKKYSEMLPLQCGMPLFAVSNEFNLKEKIFLKQSVTCGETMENIYYYGIKPPLSFPVVCVYCGRSEEITSTDTTLKDGRKTRP